jgi:hypothetical protein
LLFRTSNIPSFTEALRSIIGFIGQRFPEALVTDESCFSDFPLEDADYERLSHQYGIDVGGRDRIAAVAERLASLFHNGFGG